MAVLGIDLGTTFSLVGYMQGGKPCLIPDSMGNVLVPSVIHVDHDNQVFAGQSALGRAVLDPANTVRNFKRDMGSDVRYTIRGRQFSPEELSALVLAELKRNAEDWLGQPCPQAVITVPAYFGEAQRNATRTAAQIAGLEVLRLVNEPTAAAISFGFDNLETEARIAVLDLGGGTFDVTVLEIFEGVLIKSSSGDIRLGGVDFDEALLALVESRLQREGIRLSRDEKAWARALQAAERLKKQLSSQDSADFMVIDALLDGGRTMNIKHTVQRDDAELAWDELGKRLCLPIQRALADSGWNAGDIDEVLLVGGSSRLPLMSKLALNIFTRFPRKDVQPDQAVALGAVLTAGLMAQDKALDDLVVTDIAPFTMGLDIGHLEEGNYIGDIYCPIIERGTVIPCSRSQYFHPLREGGGKIVVNIYQGEHPDCKRNTKIGTLEVSGIPKDRQDVEIRFTYDVSGLLEVEATIQGTGKIHTTVIDQSTSRLSDKEIRRIREGMAKLKVPPAEERINAVVLTRAEERFCNSLGAAREDINVLLVQFRHALVSQDPERIKAAREKLRERLDVLDLE